MITKHLQKLVYEFSSWMLATRGTHQGWRASEIVRGFTLAALVIENLPAPVWQKAYIPGRRKATNRRLSLSSRALCAKICILKASTTVRFEERSFSSSSYLEKRGVSLIQLQPKGGEFGTITAEIIEKRTVIVHTAFCGVGHFSNLLADSPFSTVCNSGYI